MNNLKIVEYENYGNYETHISDVNFVEVRTKGSDGEYKIHSIWYGNIKVNIDASLMKNPVEYIELLKSKGYKKLKATTIKIGAKLD